MLGDVRIASLGLKSTQVELVPWGDGDEVTVIATAADGVEHVAAEVSVVDGVASATLPLAATAEPGQLDAVWEHAGGEKIYTTIEVRGGRLPVRELAAINPTGAINDPGTLEWKRERALSDALLDFEGACDVPMMPRRVTVSPTQSGGGRIVWGVPRVHRVVSCSDPAFDLSTIVVGPAFGTGYAPDGATFVVEHGETMLASDVRRAILLLASSRIADGPADARGFLLHDGGATRLRRAGERFDIDEIEAAFRRHRRLKVR